MERRAIAVRGIVQGVGFRPFVHELARRLDLRGFVRNHTGGVLIEVEGEPSSLDRFVAELGREPPPLATIDQLSWERRAPLGEQRFRIEASVADTANQVFISPDVATCADCLAELFDPADRRYGYPFINCMNCGPRLTIVTAAPYDRERTTMASFVMCGACRAEYEDPVNRRFHAQATCCPTCGPRLELRDGRGNLAPCDEPLAELVAAIRVGRTAALKGLGGFHLLCNARSEASVRELRRRKHRDEKPFAIMVQSLDAVQELCDISCAERELLLSPRRPIVLLRKRSSIEIAESVAPRNPCLGVMLPYTPLHHLLLRAMDGIPLVMTSGNRSDEPIAYENEQAIERLAGIADLFLIHNRPIHVRCDDSVTRIVGGIELPARRSRGYAPQPIRLPVECPHPILAVGGQLKGTFALGRARHAFLSHHLGDLGHYDAYRAFEKDLALYQQLFDIRPDWIAHDLHPDYASTRYAMKLAETLRSENQSETRLLREAGLLLAVQHHHAHMASCMAEHGLSEPVIGVTFDGTGFGTDGAIWGGEFLVGDYRQFQRAAHLRYVGMPGGEQAIREPWRMALAYLRDAGQDRALLKERVSPVALRTVEKMLDLSFNTPPTSSVGRLFDAVACLAGIRNAVSYEGQAAMELEWLATDVAPDGTYPYELLLPQRGNPRVPAAEPPLVLDTRPVIQAVAEDARTGVRAALIARRFHSTMVQLIATVCGQIRKRTGIEVVVLSGGVFLNALLTGEVTERLTNEGFRVYRHHLVPPNDGGLSLGQVAVAAVQMSCASGS